MNYKNSYLRCVSDLDQRLFKTRKELCDMFVKVQPACEGNDYTLIIKLFRTIELVCELMQGSVDTIFKIHRENIASNTVSEMKSMYQPYRTKKASFALHRL